MEITSNAKIKLIFFFNFEMYSLLSKRILDNFEYYGINIYSTKIYYHKYYGCSILDRRGTTIINVIDNMWDGTYPIIEERGENNYIFNYGNKLNIRYRYSGSFLIGKRTFTLLNYKKINGKFEANHCYCGIMGNFKLGIPVMPWITVFENGIGSRMSQIKFSIFIKNSLEFVKRRLRFYLSKHEWRMHPIFRSQEVKW